MIQDILPHVYDVTYKRAEIKPCDTVLVYREGKLLCHVEEGLIRYPTAKELECVCARVYELAKFMFVIDGANFFEIQKEEIKPFSGYEYVAKRDFRELGPDYLVFAGVTGFHVHDWYTDTSFCGRCGANMKGSTVERAMVCPSCGKIYYPQICPSVIVGVIDQDKLLLTKYSLAHSKHRNYALIAGYVEVGESFEDTVKREVMEEVGLKVKNIRYYKSQPWPFSNTLLAGYFCDLDGDREVKVDESELSTAVWLTRDEIPDTSNISLTGTMMMAFKRGDKV
ncbi:MAG: NAD(+) diphosphatase [Clostridia bacterium]|nr:NAD(+) diphosphatase [Clostridia bacterium]